MRPPVILVALALALALGGCGGDERPEEPRLSTPPRGGDDLSREPAGPRPNRNASDPEVIRGWVAAVNAGRFEHAASFFARGAVVEQVDETRLRTRADALRFNEGLPCRSEVTDIRDEGETSIAAFRLRPGPMGRCAEGGTARVRFRIRDGLILEWRQLPEPEGDPAADA